MSAKSENFGCHVKRVVLFYEPGILILLSEKPSYGYEIMEELKAREFFDKKPDPGAVYRTLRKLEKQGNINSKWETENSGPARRVYRITAGGKKLLKNWAEMIKKRKSMLDKILSEYEKVI